MMEFLPASECKQPLIDNACFGGVQQVIFCLILRVNKSAFGSRGGFQVTTCTEQQGAQD